MNIMLSYHATHPCLILLLCNLSNSPLRHRAVAAFHGAENEIFATQGIESISILYIVYSLDSEGCHL